MTLFLLDTSVPRKQAASYVEAKAGETVQLKRRWEERSAVEAGQDLGPPSHLCEGGHQGQAETMGQEAGMLPVAVLAHRRLAERGGKEKPDVSGLGLRGQFSPRPRAPRWPPIPACDAGLRAIGDSLRW
jgi:hypothetical protein